MAFLRENDREAHRLAFLWYPNETAVAARVFRAKNDRGVVPEGAAATRSRAPPTIVVDGRRGGGDVVPSTETFFGMAVGSPTGDDAVRPGYGTQVSVDHGTPHGDWSAATRGSGVDSVASGPRQAAVARYKSDFAPFRIPGTIGGGRGPVGPPGPRGGSDDTDGEYGDVSDPLVADLGDIELDSRGETSSHSDVRAVDASGVFGFGPMADNGLRSGGEMSGSGTPSPDMLAGGIDSIDSSTGDYQADRQRYCLSLRLSVSIFDAPALPHQLGYVCFDPPLSTPCLPHSPCLRPNIP